MAGQKGIDVRVDAYAAQGAARRMCEQKNLRVSFDLKQGEAPYSENGTIHLSAPTLSMSKEGLNTWWGQLIHETCHNTKRGQQGERVLKNVKGLKPDSIQGMAHMLVEDSVVDAQGVGEYLGQDETASLYSAHRFEANTNNPQLKKMLWENPKLDEEGIVLGTTLLMDAYARQNYQADMVGRYHDVLSNNKLHPEIKHRFEESIEKGWGASLIDLQDKSAEEAYEWTREWFDAIHKAPPPPPANGGGGENNEDEENKEKSEGGNASAQPDSGQQPEKGDPDGQKGDGKNEENQEGSDGADSPSNKEGQSEAESSSTKQEARDSGKRAKDATRYLFKELARDDHAKHDLDEQVRRKGDMNLDYDEFQSNTYTPAPAHQFHVIDYHANKVYTGDGRVEKSSIGRWRGGSNPLEDSYIQVRDTLAHNVKRYIQEQTRTRIERNRKKGKIDQKKLYKLGVKDAGRDWQERVFWKKDDKLSVKETAVSLLVDCSGSMSGPKIDTAIQCMDLVGNVCEAIGVNYEMAGFTTGGWHHTYHAIFKPFGVRMGRTQIAINMEGATSFMTSNADGENVLFAYHRLLAQQAKRRVLIVMSDGQPASAGGDCVWFLKQVVKGIEDEGLVEIHGIGIMSNDVRNFYKSHSVLKNAEQLEAALLTVLKNNVIRVK